MQTFTLLSQALELAAKSTNHIGYIEAQGKEHSLSYSQLQTDAIVALGALQAKGVKQGDEVVLFINNNPLFIKTFWACILGGIVPVPVAVGISAEHRSKLGKILTKLDSPWLLIADKDLDRLSDNHDALLAPNRIIAPATVETVGESGIPATTVAADDTAFIQFSSGSTSDPKGVVLTHKNLLTNINGISNAVDLVEDDISLSWMPLTHDMGLIGFHLTMLCSSVTHYIMPTEVFSRRPLLWLEMASEKSATMTCSPNFGYKHYLRALGEKEPKIESLANLRLIFNGAEPISTDLIRQFLDRLKPFGLRPESMNTVYGLAEASLAVAFPPHADLWQQVTLDRRSLGVSDAVKHVDENSDHALSFVIEGPAVDGCMIRITDHDNELLANDHVGRIQISGGNVTSGYYKDEISNATSITPDGWVDTGDLGFMSDSGLVVTGRNKEIIFAQGLNYYPHDLEALLIENGVSELGKVIATGHRPAQQDEDEVILFVLFRKDVEEFLPIASDCKRILNEQTGLSITHVIPAKRIPKTTSGKVQRRLLLNDYLAGDYDPYLKQYQDLTSRDAISSEDMSANEAQLMEIVNQVIPDTAFSLDTNFFDAGISSLALAEIHQKIDDQWPGKIDIVDLFDHQTITDVANFIENASD